MARHCACIRFGGGRHDGRGPARAAVSAALGAIHVSPASPAPDLADFVHETSRVTMVGFFVLNALFEELIGRAYLISETTALTGSQTVAIGASVLLAGDVSPLPRHSARMRGRRYVLRIFNVLRTHAMRGAFGAGSFLPRCRRDIRLRAEVIRAATLRIAVETGPCASAS